MVYHKNDFTPNYGKIDLLKEIWELLNELFSNKINPSRVSYIPTSSASPISSDRLTVNIILRQLLFSLFFAV